MEKGFVNSIQTLGTLDGPGVRFVVFLQGCALHCGYCHNPETQEMAGGKEYTSEEIVQKAVRYKEYYGQEGGITLSGGEPILQPEFATEIFKKCHQNGINTCIDTSGSVITPAVEKLIDETDYVMLDIKFTNNNDYEKYVGCQLLKPLEFLEMLNKKGKNVRLRQVIVPTINDDDDNLLKLSEIVKKYSCVKKVELLPFKKICKTKYDALNREFVFDRFDSANLESVKRLQEKLNNLIK
ncbi:MAG: pyruvate formate lyase-activating protein [Clostridia bacterium]|nr:pyruvate formate lyase-activating protein [Clostridia bacterium]